jgi:hypothetical protein
MIPGDDALTVYSALAVLQDRGAWPPPLGALETEARALRRAEIAARQPRPAPSADPSPPKDV